MLVPTLELLETARSGAFAIGAFNIYTLEGVRAVVAAAEAAASPAILQVLPKALELGGSAFITLCRSSAHHATVPMAVQLDHCADPAVIQSALDAGISSVMADGSHLPYAENLAFTRQMTDLAHGAGTMLEAELGRLSGKEDDWEVDAREACLTDPEQAIDFVSRTEADALAVCIGNVHGKYTRPPELDFDRLAAIAQRVSLPLVLHGTSGLPDELVSRSISHGICKFNVNTELRQAAVSAAAAYLGSHEAPELIGLMNAQIEAMQVPIREKLTLFGSVGQAAGGQHPSP